MDDSHIGLIVIVLVLLIVLSALFSSSETAYSSLNQIRLKQMAKNGDRKAKIAYNNTKRFTSLITTILIGNNLVNILATSMATSLLTSLFGGAGIALATFFMTVLILIFGEVMPKIIAKSKAEATALHMAVPLHYLLIVLRPLTWIVESAQTHWEKKQNIENVTATEDELLEIVSTIEQEGVLEQDERELIESVIEFDDKNVRDIMIPKEDVVFYMTMLLMIS